MIEDEFIVDQQTGKVLDIAGGASVRNPVILYPKHGGAHQKWGVVPTDDWMKLRNPGSGLCLQVSKNGQELTVEGVIHTYLVLKYLLLFIILSTLKLIILISK